jgi:hypothetical protein
VFGQTKTNWINQIQNKPFYDVREYSWYRTNGSGATGDLSSTGAQTITLTSSPIGVAGTNDDHYVRIYDGTGTAEAVLITGGTCTSGLTSSCTLTFTTANTHTGAWKVGTATAGIQEAVNVATLIGTQRAEVVIPPGTYTVYAPTTCYGAGLTIRGAGRFSTHITQSSRTANTFVFTDPVAVDNVAHRSIYNGIHDLTIQGYKVGSDRPTAGSAIEVTRQNSFDISGVLVATPYQGIAIYDSATTGIIDSIVTDFVNTGIWYNGDSHPGQSYDEHHIVRVQVAGISTGGSLYGVRLSQNGGFTFDGLTVYGAGDGLLVDPGAGKDVHWGFISNSNFDTGSGSGIKIFPDAGTIRSLSFSNSWTASNTGYGVYAVGLNSGTAEGLNFNGHRSFANGVDGMLFGTGMTDILVNGSKISGNGTVGGAGTGIGISFYSGIDKFSVTGSSIGPTDSFTLTQAYGVFVEAAGSDNFLISDNILLGNNASVVSAATGINRKIENNIVPLADTSITLASAASIDMPSKGETTILITGTTPISMIANPHYNADLTFIFTDPAPGGFSVVAPPTGNIAAAVTATQNVPVRCRYASTLFYCK